MADISNLSNFLEDVADAIRTKKETTEKIPAANFDTEILSITTGMDTSDATATVNDIISPKTAYVNGEKITGNIATTQITLDANVVTQNLDITNDVNTMYGLSMDREYLFVMKTGAQSTTTNTWTLNVYKLNQDTYDLYHTFTRDDLDINIGPYQFSVGAWGLENNQNQLLITYKEAPYNSNVKSFVYNKVSNSISVFNPSKYMDYNAYSWAQANPTMPEITLNGGKLFQFSTSSITQLSQLINTTFGSFSNFSCNGNLVTVSPTNGSSTNWCVLRDDMTVLKNGSSNDFIPNTSGDYAFVNGVLKSFNLNMDDGTVTYDDLDFTIQAPTNYVLWFDRLVYAVFYDIATIGENNYYNIDFYTLDLDNNQTIKVFSSKGIQNHDGSFRNLRSGNFGSGLLTTISQNQLQIIYVENNQVLVTTLTYKDRKYYSNFDATVTSENILQDKTAYNISGKVVGTMPDNGELNYEVSTSEQTIPEGYTSGGTIAASPLTDSEYNECLETTQQILGQSASL